MTIRKDRKEVGIRYEYNLESGGIGMEEEERKQNNWTVLGESHTLISII